ncbi:GIN domain-containing protein [Flavobacterium selenitireducens]|uniref:GIN domain-containing protein n=1 Tax=Flavobacterium selenitireducens TaxID=2722704 RepID=UPI00168B2DB6|nr:DUF2807 domain-containing protein [Flavobacterium selenitireducens]MBD3581301.1 lipoprotein [Flavobacterium selenitireducens]
MKKIFFGLLAAALLTGCDDDALDASGSTVTETRELEEFNRLNINAGRNIKVMYADHTGITITGSDNLVRHLRSAVSNGQLSLDYDQDHINHEDVEITITLPFFKDLRLNGRRSLTTHGLFDHTENITIVSHGENDLRSVDPFTTGSMNISLTGTGNADFRTLSCQNAKASITGDGKIYVKAEQSLNALIHGSGHIYYVDHPQITSDITGSGSISSI